MKHEISKIFNLFERDITSAALYLYLCTLLNENERQLISLVEVGRKTGLSPKRVRSILSRLKEMKLIEIFLRPKRGYEIFLLGTNVLRHETNVLRHRTNVLSDQVENDPHSTNVSRHETNVSRHRTNVPCLTKTIKPRYLYLDLKSSPPPEDLKLKTSIETKLKSKSLTKKTKPKTKKLSYQLEDLELGKKWHQYALSEMKWSSPPNSWNDEFFATGIALVKRRAGLNHQQMIKIYEFVRNDNFWSANALSPKTLLNKSSRNDMRKIDNIISAIRSRNPTLKQLEKVIDASAEDKAKADMTLMMLNNPEEYFRS